MMYLNLMRMAGEDYLAKPATTVTIKAESVRRPRGSATDEDGGKPGDNYDSGNKAKHHKGKIHG